ncbi:exodeoxyribonuclease VII large subunit [bacterium]|nr:exodeoxyribonuclease VII large subunit [bacterium]MBU1154159.1 exodeoxyribonuclease VII large subunit [bacterium]
MKENDNQYIYTITEITKEIKKLLENNFTSVWIKGEISNLHIHTSGHIYFSLKDQESQIKAVIFKSKASQMNLKLRDGLNVVVYGLISIYEPRGEYQIIVDYLKSTGAGVLYEAFERLKKDLEKKGIFDPKHKRALPMIPQRIGIVTSPTGAAIRDILSVIKRRFSNIEILIVPVKVQGEGSVVEIIQAINILNKIEEMEVIILTRGGGSVEDLWSFNDERLAYAIYHSRIPIISAVGHETDFTIADFVADLRAATPSIAAEILTKNKKELSQKIKSFKTFIISRTKSTLVKKNLSYKNCQNSILFKRPYYKIDKIQQYLDHYLNTISFNFSRKIETWKNRLFISQEDKIFKFPQRYLLEFRKQDLEQRRSLVRNIFCHKFQEIQFKTNLFIEKLDSFSPLKTLGRGYSITYLYPENVIIKDSSQVKKDNSIRVKLHKGEVLAKVNEIKRDSDEESKI